MLRILIMSSRNVTLNLVRVTKNTGALEDLKRKKIYFIIALDRNSKITSVKVTMSTGKKSS